MRSKWTAILVVMFTTLTTTQEALKQYDAFKAQASAWATLSLWTGFLSTYEPPAEPLQAHNATCQAEQPHAQAQQPNTLALAQTATRESGHSRRHEASNASLRVEVSVIEDHRTSDALEASREALASVREVALLDAPADRETEESFRNRGEMAEPFVALRAMNEVDVRVQPLRKVRLAPGQAAPEDAAPVTRAQAQKSRAMKRALKIMQMRLDKATRQELSWAKGEITTEWPEGMSIAPGLPLAPPQPLALPAVMTGNGGGCAGE